MRAHPILLPLVLSFSIVSAERGFGFLEGAVNFWTGEGMQGRDGRWRLDGQPFQVPEQGFYTTDAFTGYAIDFIEETQKTQQPFFLYLAHNAPRYPLHAHPEDIEKYRGSCLKGWDRIREERWLRLQNLDLISPELPLSPHDPNAPFWDFAFHHAVLKDGYRLVARQGEDWQLYHILADRIESRNLSAQKPALVAELATAYDSWAERVGAPKHHACRNQRFNPMKDYTKVLGQL